MDEKRKSNEREYNPYEVYTDEVAVVDPSSDVTHLEAKLAWCGGMTFFDKNTGLTALIHFVPFETADGAGDKLNEAFYKFRAVSVKEIEFHSFMLSEDTEKQVDAIFLQKGLKSPEIEPLAMDSEGTHFPLRIEVGTGKIN